jgi:uncharacterized protein (TIGR03032 family)
MQDSPPDKDALSGVHTAGFAQILDRGHFSLAVTTYQANKLVLVRPDRNSARPRVNTHFRPFHRPMGFAWEQGRFALGTASQVREFQDMPDPPDAGSQQDATFLPRICHTTGDIQIHEMVWQPKPSGSSELWFVNTRFSCLATRSDLYSFLPRWRPPFISALAPEDRCHLNGLCLRDGEIRYVTALGSTDTPGGWRENKSAGGIVIDVKTGQTIAAGFSMPHSPRWHDGKLWILESGNGGVGTIDLTTGRYAEVCRLPGFTRGLDFVGPYAFIGLSQVRESATFSGIAISQLPLVDRCSGVWCVDTRTGSVAGFLKFTYAVQEIFAVQVLVGLRQPDVFNEDLTRIAAAFKLPEAALREIPPLYAHRSKSLSEKK